MNPNEFGEHLTFDLVGLTVSLTAATLGYNGGGEKKVDRGLDLNPEAVQSRLRPITDKLLRMLQVLPFLLVGQAFETQVRSTLRGRKMMMKHGQNNDNRAFCLE